jgi:hypothetical protein
LEAGNHLEAGRVWILTEIRHHLEEGRVWILNRKTSSGCREVLDFDGNTACSCSWEGLDFYRNGASS